MGKTVLLVSPSKHIGGFGTSGVTSKPAMQDHFKTGHRDDRDSSIYTAPEALPAIFVYTRHHLGGGYGDAGMRPERRPRRGHGPGWHRRPGLRMLAIRRKIPGVWGQSPHVSKLVFLVCDAPSFGSDRSLGSPAARSTLEDMAVMKQPV
jgi:hypothetical protein